MSDFKNLEQAMRLMPIEAFDALIAVFEERLEGAQAYTDSPHDSDSDYDSSHGVVSGMESMIDILKDMRESKSGAHPYHCVCIYCEATPNTEAHRKYKVKIGK